MSVAAQDVPTIRRFARCKIAIYADDHAPPHSHVEGRGFRAIVEIETMIVRTGDTKEIREAIDWAAANRNLLQTEWTRLNKKTKRD